MIKGKSIQIFFILMFPILLWGQTKIVLKNGASFESKYLNIHKTWIQLDSLNNEQAVMFAVIDSIITKDKDIAEKIKNYNSLVSLINIDKNFVLKFLQYPKTNKTLNYINKDYVPYYRVNIFLGVPQKYNIEILNNYQSFSGKKKLVTTGLSFGAQFLRSLSNSAMTGLCIKYHHLNYSYFQSVKNEVSWENDLISIMGIYDQKLFTNKFFELKIQIGLGILLSYQNFTNSAFVNDFNSNYKGSGVLFDIMPSFNFPMGNFQFYGGMGYSWSTFRLLYFEKEYKAVSSRNLFNNYNSMKIEFGLGYIL